MSDWTLPPMPIPAEAREHIRRFLNGWPLHEDFTAGTVTHRTGCVDCGTALVDDHRCPACDPCSCGGRRWVEDEGWSPGYHPAPDRLPGDGLIPCGFCSDWDDEPMPPYGERDSGQQATPPEPHQNGSETATVRCKRCGGSPVVAEVEGRTLVCATCRDDAEFREHAREDYR